jgi:hypothetical protein
LEDVPLIGLILLFITIGFYLATSLGEMKFMKLNEATMLEKERNMIKNSNNLYHTPKNTHNKLIKHACLFENAQMFVLSMISSMIGAFS